MLLVLSKLQLGCASSSLCCRILLHSFQQRSNLPQVHLKAVEEKWFSSASQSCSPSDRGAANSLGGCYEVLMPFCSSHCEP